MRTSETEIKLHGNAVVLYYMEKNARLLFNDFILTTLRWLNCVFIFKFTKLTTKPSAVVEWNIFNSWVTNTLTNLHLINFTASWFFKIMLFEGCQLICVSRTINLLSQIHKHIRAWIEWDCKLQLDFNTKWVVISDEN